MTEASQSRALKPIDEVRHNIDKMGPQFKMALPPHIPVERFVRVVQTAVVSNPDLLDPSKCERQSLYGAAMRLAQDGLLPDGREAAIVPFKGKAQAMPMVAGILKKVRNSGELATINAHVVRENDSYRSWVDEKGEHFTHEKSRGERGGPIYTYAYAITKDGGFYFEELTEADIQAIKNVSRSGNGGPWGGAFADEMRRKSAIRRLSKRLPMSTDVEETIRRDDELFEPDPQAQQPAAATPPPASVAEEQQTGKSRPKALRKVVDQARQGMDGPTTIDSDTGEISGGDQASGPPPGHPANAPAVDVI